MANQDTTTLLQNLQNGSAQFADVLAHIDARYAFTPTAFSNGETQNDAGQNNGSCKVFAFAQLEELSAAQTLQLFAEHYAAVLATPTDSDHANIRNFMRAGWAGIDFAGAPLVAN